MSFLLPHFLEEGRGDIDVYFTRVYNPMWINPDGFMWLEALRDESKIKCHVALTPTWNESAWFADYVLPGAGDFPNIRTIALECYPSPTNPLGAKGAGEGGIIPVGGVIANNSGGPHTLKYGVTVNHVLGLEVVLPDGEIAWLGGRTRDALGYEAVGSADESALLEKQTVLWAGRGRRIIGLHVSKQVCTPAQAEVLLQKVIDAVP